MTFSTAEKYFFDQKNKKQERKSKIIMREKFVFAMFTKSVKLNELNIINRLKGRQEKKS